MWQGWSGRSGSPACSSLCTHPPAPPGSEVTGPRRQQEVLPWQHARNLGEKKKKKKSKDFEVKTREKYASYQDFMKVGAEPFLFVMTAFFVKRRQANV